jgi:hypothetical protein
MNPFRGVIDRVTAAARRRDEYKNSQESPHFAPK